MSYCYPVNLSLRLARYSEAVQRSSFQPQQEDSDTFRGKRIAFNEQ